MCKEELENTILTILHDNDILHGGKIVKQSTLLFKECGLDSVGVIDLVVCIEDRFDIEFLDEELKLQNFDTVSQIANSISIKLNDREC